MVCVWACSAACKSPAPVGASMGAGGGGDPDAAGAPAKADASTLGLVLPEPPSIISSTAEAGSYPDNACGASPFSASQVPVSILLVIDRSASMSDTYSAGVSKWTALRQALATALESEKQNIAFGLELFPYSDDPSPGMCALPVGAAAMQVPVGPGPTTVPQIIARLAKDPAGGTPTAAALANAYDFFSGAGRSLTGEKYLLLATDGGPNCNPNHAPCEPSQCTVNLDGRCASRDGGATLNCCDLPSGYGANYCLDDQATTEQIAKLAAIGVKTFVVGLPGTEAYASFLDRFALAGGAPNPNSPPSYFKVDGAGGIAGLSAILSTITSKLITTCRFQLAEDPPDVNLLNVEIDGRMIAQTGTDSWEVDRTTRPPTVVLKSATCSRVKSVGASSVHIVYGCPTILIL